MATPTHIQHVLAEMYETDLLAYHSASYIDLLQEARRVLLKERAGYVEIIDITALWQAKAEFT